MIRIVSWRGTKFLLVLFSMAPIYGCGGGSSDGNGSPPTTGTNAPTATNACIKTDMNAERKGVLPASDPDGQPLVFEIRTEPTKGVLTRDAAGNYSYTPRTGVLGMDQFTFLARDSTGRESNIATVTLLIGGAVRIMPLGDSITLGTYTTKTPSDIYESIGYRRKLYDGLAALGGNRFGINFVGSLSHGLSASPKIGDPDHEGHGGFTSNNVASGITGWLNTEPPDIILLHIGTNDLSGDPNALAAPVSSILQNIDTWEQSDSRGPWRPWVFVARIIQRLDNVDVTRFNDDIVARVTARNNSRQPGQRPFFVVDQQTGAGLNYATGSGGDMADALHPNQLGYDKMADKWLADLLAAGVLPSCP